MEEPFSCAIGYSDRALNDGGLRHAIRLCKEQPVLGSFTEAHYKEKRCIQEAKRKHRRTTQGLSEDRYKRPI